MWALALAAATAATPSEAIRGAVATRLGIPVADVEVSAMAPIPGLQEADWSVELPLSGPITGNVPVVLRSGAGRYAVRPVIVAWREVPVAAEATAAGQTVPLAMARVSSDRLRGETVVERGSSWVARVDLAAGDPVTTSRARAEPDARRGAEIRVVTECGALSIQAPGVLLGDAYVGKPVSAMNLSTHVVLSGTYRSDGVVLLEGS